MTDEEAAEEYRGVVGRIAPQLSELVHGESSSHPRATVTLLLNTAIVVLLEEGGMRMSRKAFLALRNDVTWYITARLLDVRNSAEAASGS